MKVDSQLRETGDVYPPAGSPRWSFRQGGHTPAPVCGRSDSLRAAGIDGGLVRQFAANLSPEQQMVITCLRRSLGQVDSSKADSPGEVRLDWREVSDLLLSQGLAPLAYPSLAALDSAVPDAVRANLRASYLAAAVREEVWLEPLLRRTLDALQGEGLEPIVLKGAALAYTAYPKPFLRTMGDIDLLLPREQVARASQTLQKIGLRANDVGPRTDHHLPMHYMSAGQLGVELHYDVLPASNPFAVNVEDLRSRSQAATLAHVSARVLSPADALHLACVHMSYAHRYRALPLRTLTDIMAITTSYRGKLDWDLFLAAAKSSRTAGAVYWPLVLSQAWLGAPVPESVLSEMAPSPVMRRLVGAVAEPRYILEGRAPASPGSDVLYSMLLNLSLYSGCAAAEQARVVWQGLFPSPQAVGHL
ncbi:MAG: nucleotidyltransferase domain-containing protein, partial [Chloroflexota bacterium]